MTDYSALFLEHYRRPRNLGDLDAPDGIALLRDDTCGDVLRLALRVGRDPGGECPEGTRIRAARFKAFGCAATIAVGSILTETVIGLPLREAAALRVADISEALGGLPAGRLHAAILGHQALRAAIERATDQKGKTGATER